MSIPNYRNIRPTGHITEMLEAIKTEFDNLGHDSNVTKMQKEDLERKLAAQITEMTNIQNAIYELERSHIKLKQQYEEDMRHKRQPDMHPYANGSGPVNGEQAGTPQMMGNGFGGPGYPSMSIQAHPQMNQSMPPPPPPHQQQPHHPPPDHHHPNKRQRVGPEQTSDGHHEQGPYQHSPVIAAPAGGSVLPVLGGFEPGFPKGPGFGPPPPMNKVEKDGIPPSHSPLVLNPVNNGPSPSPGFPSNQPRQQPVPSMAELPEGVGKSMEVKQQYVEDKEGPNSDWVIGYHPNVQPNMKVELAHTLDHSSVVCCVKFSYDGKYLATGSNRSANIFDIDSGDKIHVFDGSTAEGAGSDQYIRSVCFSPDGKYLAAGGEDRTVKVWDIEKKSLSNNFTGHTHEIYSLDFSQKQNLIVSGGGDRKVRVWDMDSRKCLFELGGDEMGPKDGVTSVAFSPDGRYIAAGSLDCVVRLWETHTGYFLDRFEGHTDSVYSVAFSPDGKSLASGSLDKTLKLWDLSNSKQKARATFAGHKDYVLSVAFSPEGNWLVSGSKDRTVQFWDPRNAMAHMMLQGHKNSVISVAMSPASGALATGSGDNRARIWKYRQSH